MQAATLQLQMCTSQQAPTQLGENLPVESTHGGMLCYDRFPEDMHKVTSQTWLAETNWSGVRVSDAPERCNAGLSPGKTVGVLLRSILGKAGASCATQTAFGQPGQHILLCQGSGAMCKPSKPPLEGLMAHPSQQPWMQPACLRRPRRSPYGYP